VDVFIGTIQPFAFNFAPRGWMACNGQLLSIAQYSALFSLIGTTYGGNGTTTFGLPDLRSRVTVHQGTGPGLSTYSMGEMTGVERETLLSTNMPVHTHQLMGSASAATSATPAANMVLAMANGADSVSGDGATVNTYGTTANTTLSPQAIGMAGGSQPFSILQPLLAVNFCIAVEGIFPSRN
jgi:microcystin-dependent protein